MGIKRVYTIEHFTNPEAITVLISEISMVWVMKIAAFCFFGLLVLAFIMVFRESMPGPLALIGYGLAQSLESIIEAMRGFFAFNPTQ